LKQNALQQLLDLNRLFPHASSGCMVDRRRGASQPDLADTACPQLIALSGKYVHSYHPRR